MTDHTPAGEPAAAPPDLRPLEISDEQWNAIAAADKYANWRGNDIDTGDVTHLLGLAREALGHRDSGSPLAMPELLGIDVFDTSDQSDIDMQVIVRFEVNGTTLRLASDFIDIGDFGNDLVGPAAARAVFAALLGYRNLLIRQFCDALAALGADPAVMSHMWRCGS